MPESRDQEVTGESDYRTNEIGGESTCTVSASIRHVDYHAKRLKLICWNRYRADLKHQRVSAVIRTTGKNEVKLIRRRSGTKYLRLLVRILEQLRMPFFRNRGLQRREHRVKFPVG